MADLKAGSAKVCINPPLGTEMAGFIARAGVLEGIHDDLRAKTLILKNDGTYLVLISLDLIGLQFNTLHRIKESIKNHVGLQDAAIVISTTHTHSGPATLESSYLGEVNQAYLNSLVEKIVVCVKEAVGDLEDVQLKIGKGVCKEVGKNRRVLDGITDPDVTVLSVFKKNSNKLKSVLVNYTCHPTVLGPENLQLSADYPYFLYHVIEEVYDDVNVLFVNGAAGNINVGHHAHDSINGKAFNIRTFAEAEKHGYTLAGEVLKTIQLSAPVHNVSIKTKTMDMKITFEREEIIENLQKEIKLLNETDEEKLNDGQLKMFRVKQQWLNSTRQNPIEKKELKFTVLSGKIGDINFVTLPGEFFVELGLKVKEAFPKNHNLILGYSNGSLGYVPNTAAYAFGGYEVEEAYQFMGYPAPLPKGTGEKIISQLIESIKQLG